MLKPGAQGVPLDEGVRLALAGMGIQKIRAACAGNGIKPDSVRLGRFEPVLVTFNAKIHLKLRASIQNSRTAGKKQGEVCLGYNDVHTKLETYLSTVMKNDDVQAAVKAALKARKDFGFGIDKKDILPLREHDRTWLWYENCTTCQGDGRMTCQRCNGGRQEQCYKCHGHMRIPCVHCRSTGKVNLQNREQNCTYCQGRGQAPCDLCRQSGRIQCRTCRARGDVPCQVCNTSGWFTHSTQASIALHPDFSYEREGLPEDVLPMIDRHASALVIKKTIEAGPSADFEVREDRSLILPYTARFPYGTLNFVIGEKPMRPLLFGFTAEFLRIPDFLENYLSAGMAELEGAAAAKGNIAARLSRASRYRFFAMASYFAAKFSAKKTAENLRKKYPFGVSQIYIEKTATLADAATRGLTRFPRYASMIVGLALNAALFGGYFAGSVRNMIVPAVPNIWLMACLDVALLGAACFLPIALSQYVARTAVHKALGPALLEEKKRGLTPKPGKTVYWSAGLTLLLFIAGIELAAHSTPALSPSWYAYAKARIISFF